MSLPDFGNMSLIGWLVLAAIAGLCAVSVYVVEDEKKKGRKVPGKMCAGCQENGMKPEEDEQGEIFL
ncbi:MAG: hypothetical protein KH452_11675 [Clostridiales bacterium]|nr:hypothetical protein [Clostridiales bacterium]